MNPSEKARRNVIMVGKGEKWAASEDCLKMNSSSSKATRERRETTSYCLDKSFLYKGVSLASNKKQWWIRGNCLDTDSSLGTAKEVTYSELTPSSQGCWHPERLNMGSSHSPSLCNEACQELCTALENCTRRPVRPESSSTRQTNVHAQFDLPTLNTNAHPQEIGEESTLFKRAGSMKSLSPNRTFTSLQG